MAAPSARRHQPQERGAAHKYQSRRRSLGGDQVEGRQSVKELILANRRRVEQVWMEETVQRKGVAAQIADLCMSRRIPLLTVSQRRFEMQARSEGNQGVIAKAAALRETDIDELAAEANAFLVVLDNITDPHNLGAILRSAELAGVTGIVLPQNRATMITPTVTKSAAGAIEYLNFALVSGVPTALMQLKNSDITVIGLDASGARSIFSTPKEASQRVAVVMGSEDKGIARLAAERCDFLAKIPQLGHLDSLNVSAAAAIALFEVARLRQG